MYTINNGRIYNEIGEIAVRWNMLTTKQIFIGNHEYWFNIRANISLAWVKPEHIDKMLSVKTICCGGTGSQSCHLASELDVKRWLGISIW